MALVRGAAIGLGAVAMSADLGEMRKLVLVVDSSASRGMALRRGVGRVRHVHTPLLWVQDWQRRGDFRVVKIPGPKNVADLGTKPLPGPSVANYMGQMDFTFEVRPSSLALKAAMA